MLNTTVDVSLEKNNSKQTFLSKYTQALSLMGRVVSVDINSASFVIKTRSGDQFRVYMKEQTQVRFLQNLDNLDRDRMPNPENYNWSNPSSKTQKYIHENRLIVVYGNYIEDGQKNRFDAREVYLLQSPDGSRFLFEEKHWWLTQITCLADTWLENLFGEREKYDFTQYNTNISIAGAPDEDKTIQECATLSRLIYGFSSSYLLNGCERHLEAAKNGVIYQREHFRSLSHDGEYCIWAFGKRGNRILIPSENGDDKGTIPLYEQIYAIAGLTQYYRITQEWEVLEDIEKTVNMFNKFFLDKSEHGGYFSHVDYTDLSPDSIALGDNRLRKNWNSIGDHIPAYLINLISALDPIPVSKHSKYIGKFLDDCKQILNTTSDLILNKFPDSDPNIPFVNERFYQDWTPDKEWRWQQDRAVIGHNLKIAWNLTRVANYYYDKDRNKSDRLMELANNLGKTMGQIGVDQVRSGIFDVAERQSKNGMFIDFTWGNTKDFWQQEQAILAYLILYGYEQNQEYKELAQEMSSFWNLFFLDKDFKNIYFRVTENGIPIIKGDYGNKGGHSISGYHAFELNFLAHIYFSAYVKKSPFCLYFKPSKECNINSINILPDFFKHTDLEVTRITLNGIDRSNVDPDNFQIELCDQELGSEVVVELTPKS